ncbi:MAG: AbrB/MazE/SpoVT family DNA-binding domain-containing protein [Novosphingobium sp.]|nr:AbrB/MazE/SpoVT family DNA-binding domain-containing protein [Novosphingobium sp.]
MIDARPVLQVRISSRGRITLPASVRRKLRWTAGARLNWAVSGDGVTVSCATEDRPAADR